MNKRTLMRGAIALVAGVLTACGGGDAETGGPSNEPRFILASDDGLSEVRLDLAKRSIIKWEDNSYPLDPAVSPDGKSIAFGLQSPAKSRPDGSLDFGSDIRVVGTDGKGERELVKHNRVAEFLRTPAWISNEELLYTYRGRKESGESDVRIERLEVASGRSTRFIESAMDPAISKDRRQIVYNAIDPRTQEETLMVAGIDLAGRRPVVDASSKLALFSSQVFSPDGTKIAFAAVDLKAPLPGGSGAPTGIGVFAAHPFAQDVWMVNVDGTGLHRMAEIAENMPSIVWSPDGSSLYVLGPGAFWRIDATTGQAEKIGPGIPLGQIVWLSGP